MTLFSATKLSKSWIYFASKQLNDAELIILAVTYTNISWINAAKRYRLGVNYHDTVRLNVQYAYE
jgi:hypothetical protein